MSECQESWTKECRGETCGSCGFCPVHVYEANRQGEGSCVDCIEEPPIKDERVFVTFVVQNYEGPKCFLLSHVMSGLNQNGVDCSSIYGIKNPGPELAKLARERNDAVAEAQRVQGVLEAVNRILLDRDLTGVKGARRARALIEETFPSQESK